MSGDWVIGLAAGSGCWVGLAIATFRANRWWRKRRASMWHELGLRQADHGPLTPTEITEVIDHWLGS